MKQASMTEIQTDPWQKLYRVAGAAALVLLVYSLATMLILALTGGQPATIEDCFLMLQKNRLVGLLRLDLLMVFAMPCYYLLFLGFFVAYRQVNIVDAALATVLVFVGVTLVLAAPSVFSYLFLSDKFAAAITEAQRSQILAAGEAVLAADFWHGTSSMIGGLLLQSGAVLISIVMLRGKVFNRATAYVGIVTHGLDLAHILVAFFSSDLSNILMAIAGPMYLVWFPLVASRFLQPGHQGKAVHSHSLLNYSTGD